MSTGYGRASGSSSTAPRESCCRDLLLAIGCGDEARELEMDRQADRNNAAITQPPPPVAMVRRHPARGWASEAEEPSARSGPSRGDRLERVTISGAPSGSPRTPRSMSVYHSRAEGDVSPANPAPAVRFSVFNTLFDDHDLDPLLIDQSESVRESPSGLRFRSVRSTATGDRVSSERTMTPPSARPLQRTSARGHSSPRSQRTQSTAADNTRPLHRASAGARGTPRSEPTQSPTTEDTRAQGASAAGRGTPRCRPTQSPTTEDTHIQGAATGGRGAVAGGRGVATGGRGAATGGRGADAGGRGAAAGARGTPHPRPFR
jgi:hypothetical protein